MTLSEFIIRHWPDPAFRDWLLDQDSDVYLVWIADDARLTVQRYYEERSAALTLTPEKCQQVQDEVNAMLRRLELAREYYV